MTVVAFPAAANAQQPSAPPDFVALDEVDGTILHDIRYTSSTTSSDAASTITTTRSASSRGRRRTRLPRRRQALRPQGYTLKVYDCYRPQTAVDDFVGWARRLRDDRMKAEFYPRVDKSRLFEDGYIAERSGHSRGSTVDLTLVKLPARPQPRWRPSMGLVDCAAPYAERFPDNTVDMGTGFDCFDTLSHTLDPRIQGRGAREPIAAQAHARGRWLPQLRARVVALHAPRRAVPGDLLRLPGLAPRAALSGLNARVVSVGARRFRSESGAPTPIGLVPDRVWCTSRKGQWLTNCPASCSSSEAGTRSFRVACWGRSVQGRLCSTVT